MVYIPEYDCFIDLGVYIILTIPDLNLILYTYV